MNYSKIQTVICTENELPSALEKIAKFCASTSHENAWDGIRQKIECERGLISPLNFHNEMRAEIGDADADLVTYNGGRGTVYLSFSPASARSDGNYKIAILARAKNANEMTLPDVVEIPGL